MRAAAAARYGFVLWASARQQWVYRTEMAARSIQMVLFMGVFMALWSTAYSVSGRSDLQGFRLVDMVWYLAMTETITLSSSRIFVDIAEAVRSGDVAYMLARPTGYPLFQVASSLGNSLPRFLLNLITASTVVTLGMGRLPFLGGARAVGSLPGLAAFLVTAALALLLDALVAVLIGLLAFWLEEVMPVFWIYQKLLFTVGGLFLPLEMFPQALQRIAAWLPFQFITYVPARVFVAVEPLFLRRALLGQVIYVAVAAGLVTLVWRLAQRRLVVHGG
ncbi:MAG: ABC transporter permease [Chloroflexota bacterium]